MALKKARVGEKKDDVLDQYAIPEVPDKIKRDRWDRPLVKQSDGSEIAYTRASTLGKAIEDDYHLNLWKQRCVAFGMSRRKDLVAAAASIKTNEGDDRKALQEVCEKAHEAARGDEGANIGTALHLLSERRDKGEDLSYLPDIMLEAMDAYAECMKYVRVLATEVFVVCDELETAGSFDRVVELLVDLEFNYDGATTVLPRGTILVLDLKTGKLASAKYWGAGYGAQQTVYANGVPYGPEGRLKWSEVLGEDVEPSKDWALILHVPGDSPSDAGFVLVDLELGAEMAGLAKEIKDIRKRKGLMLDAFPVGEPPVNEAPKFSKEEIDAMGGEKKIDVAQVIRTKIIAAITKAGSEEELWEIADMAIEDGLWDEDCKRAARVKQREFDNLAAAEEATWD